MSKTPPLDSKCDLCNGPATLWCEECDKALCSLRNCDKDMHDSVLFKVL